jgi:hypothetical protein
MSDDQNLQFDKAEFAEPAASRLCFACKGAITDSYFEVAGQVVCPACRARAAAAEAPGGGATRFFTALALGLGAAAIGTGVYYAVRAITGYEFGLIAILVGLGVGAAVKRGAQARGGWVYQGMAIFLTYLSIVCNYIPDIVTAVNTAATADGGSPPSGIAMVIVVPLIIGFAFIAPFLEGMKNFMGLLIIGFALYEAWKINKRVKLVINGPFKVEAPGATQSAEPPAPAPAINDG